MIKLILSIFITFVFSSPSLAIVVGQSKVSSGGGSCGETEQIPLDTLSDFTNWIQDESWTVSGVGGIYPSSGFTTARLRNNTTVNVECQWGKIELVSLATDSWSGVLLRATGSTGYLYGVVYNHGSTQIEWRVLDGNTNDQVVQTSSVTLSVNDVIAAKVEGTGNDTVISVWVNPTGGSTPSDWGAADYTLTNNPTNPADTGTYIGIITHRESGTSKPDNFSGGD